MRISDWSSDVCSSDLWSFTRILSSGARGEADMADLKLPKLPDRTPVKITFSAMPDLFEALNPYAAAYEAAYCRREPVPDLIPFMLRSEKRSVGKVCFSTCRIRWWAEHLKKKTT